jgi:hypothetical protein
MKTKLVFCLVLSTVSLAGSARAQTVQVTTPAPVVPLAAPAAAVVPNQYVYAARLPGVNELTNIAAAQGLAIERIVQTPTQIVAVYKYPNGQTTTVAYLPLPGAGATYAPTVTPPTPAPTVVYYDPAPRAVYYDGYGPDYYYSNRGYWYPPVALSLGFGFRGGGGYHGGFHRGR